MKSREKAEFFLAEDIKTGGACGNGKHFCSEIRCDNMSKIHYSKEDFQRLLDFIYSSDTD